MSRMANQHCRPGRAGSWRPTVVPRVRVASCQPYGMLTRGADRVGGEILLINSTAIMLVVVVP
jgi:hypothetical protein